MSESSRQFTSVDSSIVKGPIRLRDSRGQNLAADTNLYQAPQVAEESYLTVMLAKFIAQIDLVLNSKQ